MNPENLNFNRFKKKTLALLYKYLSQTLYQIKTIKHKKLRKAIILNRLITIQMRDKFKIDLIKAHRDIINVLLKISDTQVASGSSDKDIKLWDISIGKCLMTFEGHSNGVVGLATLQQIYLVSGAWDSTIKVWIIRTGKCFKTIEAHNRALCWIVNFSNTEIASNSSDRTIKIWDFSSPVNFGICKKTFTGHTDSVVSIAKLNSNLLVGGGSNWDPTIRIWNLDTTVCRSVLEGHTRCIYFLLKLDQIRFVSASADSTIKIWDFSTDVCLKSITAHNGGSQGLIQLNETQFASGGADKTIKIWDMNTYECVNTLKGHDASAFYLIMMNEFVLVSGGWDNSIRIWLI